MAGACRALGRLVAAGVGESRAATATAPSDGERAPTAAAASSAGQQGPAPPPETLGPPAADAQPDPPAVAARLGGDSSAKGLFAVVSACMILLALTAIAVREVVGGRAAPDRWRSALDSARAARRELGEALPVLLAVGLAVSSAIALFWWILMN